jgi:predicted SprT family Zn-dependent metalloprotease
MSGEVIEIPDDETSVVDLVDSDSSIIDLVDSDDEWSDDGSDDGSDEPEADKPVAKPEVDEPVAKPEVDEPVAKPEVDEPVAKPEAVAGPSRRAVLSDEDLRAAYDEINEKAFDGKLPKDLTVMFERMLKSRGGDYFPRHNRIRISPTVCDTAHKMRSVLLHECCHAAEHHIDKAKCGHGPNFLKWAEKASAAMPDLAKVERLHHFRVPRKYLWKCPKCDKMKGSHHLGKVKCCGQVQILKKT